MRANARRILAIGVLLALFAASAVVFSAFPTMRWNARRNNDVFASALPDGSLGSEESILTVVFSHEGHFYAEDIEVCLSVESAGDYEIYYTLTGDTPSKEKGILYTGPIAFEATDALACHVIKAIAYTESEVSKISTHTYFVGKHVHARFDTYVFSLSTEPDNLFDYEYGIHVHGKIYDDYMAENPDADTSKWYIPANYHGRGREWERPVYVEAFRQDGERVVAQHAGLRIHGAYSRTYPQKSLRLITRRDYEPLAGRFHYDFFTNPIASHDTFILRNDGNDFYRARIRTPLASYIAHEAGFPAIPPLAPAAVFVNGDYYGFAWLSPRVNEHFLESLYDAPQRAFDIVDGGNDRVGTTSREIEDEFNKVLAYALEGDTEAIALHFDVDNLLLYYALKAYIGDSDWPHNNIAIWRYTGPQPEEGGPVKELDGRWRYVFFDTDRSLGGRRWRLTGDEDLAPYVRSIERLLDGRSPILQALLQRPEYAEAFANYICDMAAYHFSADNAERVIEVLNDMRMQELAQSIAKRDMTSMFPDPRQESMTMEGFWEEEEGILSYLEWRPEYTLDELYEVFGFSWNMYRISVQGTDGANAFLHSIPINGEQSVESTYFVDNKVILRAEADFDHVFDYWLINGTKHYDPTVTLDASMGAEINAELFVTPKTFDSLIISRVYYAGNQDWIELHNPTGHSISTRGYFLSNDADKPGKYALRGYTIGPGESLLVLCRNNRSIEALKRPTTNFNLRAGETLYLTDRRGNAVSSVHLHPVRAGQELAFDFTDGVYKRTAPR